MQTPAIVQPGVEVRELHSSILDQDLLLYIKLPWKYEQGEGVYPALYSLDANRSFSIYASMSLTYETPVFHPKEEIIIVGIGYRLDDDRLRGLAQWSAWRTRDLTLVNSAETDAYWQENIAKLLDGEQMQVHSGGAAGFLRALREEIIPFVEANYRVLADDRGLAGYSYGGLFALYALFQEPGLFSRIFAGSPSIDDDLRTREENYAAAHKDLPGRLLMTIGEQEGKELELVQSMSYRLRSRVYPGLKVQFHILEGEGHVSGMAAAISRALRMLYYTV